jgi:DNA-binding SARP family transcriptional activator
LYKGTQAMATIHIQLLGEFRLVYDDALVPTVNTPRLQALLAYLLLHRAAPQSRRHLAFLFWPDSSEAQARTNLRHQFHLLRQAFPTLETFLLTDAQTVQWRPDRAYQFDVADFEMATAPDVTQTALQAAVDLYRGDLLPSCYDDWILPLRERLRQRFIEAIERLQTPARLYCCYYFQGESSLYDILTYHPATAPFAFV